MAGKAGRALGTRQKAKEEGKTLEKFLTSGAEEEGDRNMERILREIGEMRKQMDKMQEQMNENMTEQIGQLRREMLEERKAREEETQREREMWQEEKKVLEERILELEVINEKKERENRRNNIVIKGADWKPEVSKLEVNEFLKESLKMEVEVQNIRTLNTNRNRKLVIGEVNRWEIKGEIMKRKKGLPKGIFIEDDLTRKEREVQSFLRNLAKEERQKGIDTWVGYMKIRMGTKWYKWNERTKKLEEDRRGGEEGKRGGGIP